MVTSLLIGVELSTSLVGTMRERERERERERTKDGKGLRGKDAIEIIKLNYHKQSRMSYLLLVCEFRVPVDRVVALMETT